MQEGKKTTLVFPPLGLSKEMLERASFLFGPPGVCLPWYMGSAAENGDNDSPSSYSVLRPPEDLKPPEGFPRLLEEYRAWMKDHSDRSALSFLSTAKWIREPTRWEIQKMVREGSAINSLELKRNEGLKWHLILHLAARLEREQQEAENALRHSRHQGSPLKDALGEGAEVPDFMDDLSSSLLHPVIEQDLFEDICKAWLGLFGGLIQEETILVTFDEAIHTYVSTLFEEAVSQLDLIQDLPKASFHMGDPLSFVSREISISSEGGVQKRVMSAMCDLERDLFNRDEGAASERAALIHSLQEMLPPRNDSDSIRLEMVSLPGIEGLHPSHSYPLLNGLSEKMLVFLKADLENR